MLKLIRNYLPGVTKMTRGQPRRVMCGFCGSWFTGYRAVPDGKVPGCSRICRQRIRSLSKKMAPGRSVTYRRNATARALRPQVDEAMAAFLADPKYVTRMAREASRVLKIRAAKAASDE